LASSSIPSSGVDPPPSTFGELKGLLDQQESWHEVSKGLIVPVEQLLEGIF